MTLKEQMREDLNFLFCLDELADKHLLCERMLTVIIDSDQLQRNALKAPGGIYDGDLLLFAKTADLVGLRLEPCCMVTFDGKPYQVGGMLDEEGATQLTLHANRGY